MIPDGSMVAYAAEIERDDHVFGDEGRVLKGEATYSHVQWKTGKRAGNIEIIRNEDLVVNGSLRHHPLTADFDTGVVQGINVQAVYGRRGSLGLLNVLAKDGHLMAFPQIAEEAMALVASRLRSDPSISEVLALLEDDEASEFVSVATALVLRDAIEGE